MPYKRKKMKKSSRRTVPYSVKRYVQAKINKNIETKHLAASGQTTTSTSVLNTQITTIPQGDDEFRRTGNRVTVTGFYGKFNIVGADSTNMVRMVLYIPKDPNDTMTSLTTYGIIDFDKYTVLSDRLITTSLSGNNSKVITIAKKFKYGTRRGLDVQFASSTTTDVKKNNIYLAWVSDSSAATHPAINYHWYCYFKDA